MTKCDQCKSLISDNDGYTRIMGISAMTPSHPNGLVVGPRDLCSWNCLYDWVAATNPKVWEIPV